MASLYWIYGWMSLTPSLCRSISDLPHAHTHIHYNIPTCNNYHGTLWCGFMENDRGVSIKGS